MKNSGSFIFGLVLLAIGIIGVMANYGIIELRWEYIWPIIVLVGGVLFELSFFIGGSKDPGLLVPGGILITVGALFTACTHYGWYWMEILWPLFILAPAIGLLQMYFFGPKDKGLLIPVGILGTVGLLFLMFNLTRTDIGGVVFPVILIVIGVVIVIASLRVNKE